MILIPKTNLRCALCRLPWKFHALWLCSRTWNTMRQSVNVWQNWRKKKNLKKSWYEGAYKFLRVLFWLLKGQTWGTSLKTHRMSNLNRLDGGSYPNHKVSIQSLSPGPCHRTNQKGGFHSRKRRAWSRSLVLRDFPDCSPSGCRERIFHRPLNRNSQWEKRTGLLSTCRTLQNVTTVKKSNFMVLILASSVFTTRGNHCMHSRTARAPGC